MYIQPIYKMKRLNLIVYLAAVIDFWYVMHDSYTPSILKPNCTNLCLESQGCILFGMSDYLGLHIKVNSL